MKAYRSFRWDQENDTYYSPFYYLRNIVTRIDWRLGETVRAEGKGLYCCLNIEDARHWAMLSSISTSRNADPLVIAEIDIDLMHNITEDEARAMDKQYTETIAKRITLVKVIESLA